MRRLAIGLLTACVVVFSGCSLEKPEQAGNKLVIKLAESASQSPLQALSSLAPGLGLLADPSTTSDFNCFTVNVTGSGITSNSKITTEGCSSPDNFNGTGPGFIATPVTRGNSMVLEIPSGLQRSVNVYGLFPSVSECGGSNSSGASGGYFLGGTKVDLLESKSITIPISLTASAISNKFTCTGSHQAGSATYVYAYGNNQIAAMKLDPTTGALTDIGTSAASGIAHLVGAPGATYLFSSNGSPTISSWALTNATGAITPASTWNSSFAMNKLLLSNSGVHWAFDVTSGTPRGQSFSPTSFAGGSDIGTSTTGFGTPGYAAIHPSLNVAYIYTGSTIRRYDFNTSTAALSNVTSVATGGGKVRLRPDGKFIYSMDITTASYWTADSSSAGDLINQQTFFPGTTTISNADFSPNSSYLYVADSSPTLFKFSSNVSTGAIAPLGSPYALPSATADLKVEPDGQYAILLHSNGTLVPYKIEATGDLTTGASHTIPGFTIGAGLVIQKVPR